MIISDRKKIIIFYALTMTLSTLFGLGYIVFGKQLWAILMAWTPGLVALICLKGFRDDIKSINLFGKTRPIYPVLGICIPVFYLASSFLLTWLLLKVAPIPPKAPFRTLIPLLVTYLIAAIGEEIGWRGYAYPILERLHGPVIAVLINGLLWGLWHLPLIIGEVYSFGLSIPYGSVMYMIGIMPVTVIVCWMRSEGRSLMPVVLLHAVDNLLNISYFNQMSTDKRVHYFAGEQGVITITLEAVIAGIVIFVWIRQRRAKAEKTSSFTE